MCVVERGGQLATGIGGDTLVELVHGALALPLVYGLDKQRAAEAEHVALERDAPWLGTCLVPALLANHGTRSRERVVGEGLRAAVLAPPADGEQIDLVLELPLLNHATVGGGGVPQ